MLAVIQVKKMHMSPAKEITTKGLSVVVSEPEDLPQEKRVPMIFPYTMQYTAPCLIRSALLPCLIQQSRSPALSEAASFCYVNDSCSDRANDGK